VHCPSLLSSHLSTLSTLHRSPHSLTLALSHDQPHSLHQSCPARVLVLSSRPPLLRISPLPPHHPLTSSPSTPRQSETSPTTVPIVAHPFNSSHAYSLLPRPSSELTKPLTAHIPAAFDRVAGCCSFAFASGHSLMAASTTRPCFHFLRHA
jgi:hypothetical protein